MMEEVTKCSYINCKEDRETEQIFHELPVCNVGLCVKWLVNSGHEELLGKDFAALQSMRFFICNKHFTNNSYIAKGTLKESAVPRPYWSCARKEKETPKHNVHRDQYMNKRVPPRTYTNRRKMIDYLHHSATVIGNDNDNIAEQWCRTCATKKPGLVSMTAKNKQTDMNLLSKLKLLIEIDEEDFLPLNMCSECVDKLEQSFQFFQQIYIADNTLRHIFPMSNISSSIHDQHNEKHIMRNNVKNKINDSKTSSDYTKTDYSPALTFSKDSSTTKDQYEDQYNKEQYQPVSEFTSKTLNEQEEGDTVYSLLTGTSENDEELYWRDVLNIMKNDKNTFESTFLKCEFCIAEFEFRCELLVHLMSSHSALSKNMCADCLICYDSKSLLINHRILYHRDKDYTCNYCQKVFLNKAKLNKHIKNLHLFKEQYSCDTCSERFYLKELLEEHIETEHATHENVKLQTAVNNESTACTIRPKYSSSMECKKDTSADCSSKSCSNSSVSTDANTVAVHSSENGTVNVTSPKASERSTENLERSKSNVDASTEKKSSTDEANCQSTKEKNCSCSCNGDCFCSLEDREGCVDYQSKKPKMCT